MPSVVHLEHVFFETDIEKLSLSISMARSKKRMYGTLPIGYPVMAPTNATRSGGIEIDTYHGYRRGLVSACADIVLVRGDKNPKVPLLWRKKAPFGKQWWVMGGAIHNFRRVEHFLLYRALVECGLIYSSMSPNDFYEKNKEQLSSGSLMGITIVGLVGCYRTAAQDSDEDENVCDTINLCYLGIVDSNARFSHDQDHKHIKWFTRDDIKKNEKKLHWYPKRVAQRALAAQMR